MARFYRRNVGSAPSPRLRFEIANAIWTNEGVPFDDAFLEAVAAAFDARAEPRDFGDPATLAAINTWVEEHTDGHIDGIVGSLDPALVMLLVPNDRPISDAFQT
jgi:serine protease inhibitor